MTDNVEFGPEIAVDGMPDWLGEDEKVIGRWREDNWFSGGPTWKKCYASPGAITAIRLPADHWAYKAIDAGTDAAIDEIRTGDLPGFETVGELMDDLNDRVTIAKMTEAEAVALWDTYLDRDTTAREDIIDMLRSLGLIKSPPTLLEQFEEHHGSLDHNQRAILEIYQEWVEGQ